jgi:hypothetical protein
MQSPPLSLALIGTAFLFLSGCATGQEWATWKAHPAHFASGEHLLFSIRNRDGEPPRVTREDVRMARAESWWGKPITVNTNEILER